METIFARCSGLDVHKESIQACVRLLDERAGGLADSYAHYSHHNAEDQDWPPARRPCVTTSVCY